MAKQIKPIIYLDDLSNGIYFRFDIVDGTYPHGYLRFWVVKDNRNSEIGQCQFQFHKYRKDSFALKLTSGFGNASIVKRIYTLMNAYANEYSVEYMPMRALRDLIKDLKAKEILYNNQIGIWEFADTFSPFSYEYDH